ncbi:nuclear transport factor 2 family protein [Streptomyces sp. NPDC047043]|uniref:nuclear transport factor 2 family protein n=1 Tax=Streptomyces sp. NPDC047043 TaxID=3154497 RepID=UPI0033FDB554
MSARTSARTSARRAATAALAAVAITAVGIVPAASATTMAVTQQHQQGDSARLAHQKWVAVHVLKGVFERGDTGVVDRFVRTDYIQHNPQVGDGAAALKAVGRSFHQQFPRATYSVKRVIAEGDLVLVHSNLVATPGTRGSAVVDIFRFQGGRIAEHWDVLEDVPATSVSGNDMFSTLSRPQTPVPGQRWLTERNKKLAIDYYDRLLVHQDLSAIDTYVAPEYHQHNPGIADGPEGARAGLAGLFQQSPQLRVEPKRIIAEGDLVAFHSHFIPSPGDPGLAIVDIFRIRDGKVVEHWDVIQSVPTTSANDNTMF